MHIARFEHLCRLLHSIHRLQRSPNSIPKWALIHPWQSNASSVRDKLCHQRLQVLTLLPLTLPQWQAQTSETIELSISWWLNYVRLHCPLMPRPQRKSIVLFNDATQLVVPVSSASARATAPAPATTIATPPPPTTPILLLYYSYSTPILLLPTPTYSRSYCSYYYYYYYCYYY